MPSGATALRRWLFYHRGQHRSMAAETGASAPAGAPASVPALPGSRQSSPTPSEQCPPTIPLYSKYIARSATKPCSRAYRPRFSILSSSREQALLNTQVHFGSKVQSVKWGRKEPDEASARGAGPRV